MIKKSKIKKIDAINAIMESVGCTPLTAGTFISIWYDGDEKMSFVNDLSDEVYRIDELSPLKLSAILEDLQQDFE